MRRTAAITGALLIPAAMLTGCSNSSTCDHLEEEWIEMRDEFDLTYNIIDRTADALAETGSAPLRNAVWLSEVRRLQLQHRSIVQTSDRMVKLGCWEDGQDLDRSPYSRLLDLDVESVGVD